MKQKELMIHVQDVRKVYRATLDWTSYLFSSIPTSILPERNPSISKVT